MAAVLLCVAESAFNLIFCEMLPHSFKCPFPFSSVLLFCHSRTPRVNLLAVEQFHFRHEQKEDSLKASVCAFIPAAFTSLSQLLLAITAVLCHFLLHTVVFCVALN